MDTDPPPRPPPSLSDISTLTTAGSTHLQAGAVSAAMDAFTEAYRAAQTIGHPHVTQTAAFNVGAVYIACRKPQQGLEYLEKALVVSDNNNSTTKANNGDLYYNFSLAYELLNNKQQAVKAPTRIYDVRRIIWYNIMYLELSLEEYQLANNLPLCAEVSAKVGSLYTGLGSPQQAARAHGIAVQAYEKLQDARGQASSLCLQAAGLYKAGRRDEAVRLADVCVGVCKTLTENNVLGKLYNELGLLYTQCGDYGRAEQCFELALPLSHGPAITAGHGPATTDRKQEAVVRQNLGAVYNSLGDYQRALGFHETAAALHAESNNRLAQGQCFTNLAFAYSRLGNTEDAGECYLHALQAARDSKDVHTQWQAMEGLGAVSFHEGNIARAVRYYELALATLTRSGENNPGGKERLVNKARDAILHQDQLAVAMAAAGTPLSRPPTRQELEILRMLEGKKVPYEHDPVALGLGGYNTEDDWTVQKPPTPQQARSYSDAESDVPRASRHHRTRSLDSGQDEVDRRHTRGRDDRQGRFRRRHDNDDDDDKENNMDTERKPPLKKNSPSKNSLTRRYSRRTSALAARLPPGGPGRRQVNLHPLLRPEGYDSEEEWSKLQSNRRHDGELSDFFDMSDVEQGRRKLSDFFNLSDDDRRKKPNPYYHRRVRPPSTPPNSGPPDPRPRTPPSSVRVGRRRGASESEAESERRRRRADLEEEERRRASLREIPVRRRVGTSAGRGREDTESDYSTPSRPRTPPPIRRQEAAGTRSRPQSGRPPRANKRPDNQAVNTDAAIREEESSQDLSDTARGLHSRYAEQLERDDTTTTEGGTDTDGYDMEDETETETETEDVGVGTRSLGPPEFTAPLPPDDKPLNTTYETPADSPPHLGQITRRGSQNFFSGQHGVTRGQGHARSEGQPGTEGHEEVNVSGARLKFSTPSADDPDYQTIRTLGRPTAGVPQGVPGPVPGPSGVVPEPPSPAPPQLPPRTEQQSQHHRERQLESHLDKMSQAEQEEFLREYFMKRHAGHDNMEAEDDVDLPQRRKRKAESRACVVM